MYDYANHEKKSLSGESAKRVATKRNSCETKVVQAILSCLCFSE
jgi:hypothetical protein